MRHPAESSQHISVTRQAHTAFTHDNYRGRRRRRRDGSPRCSPQSLHSPSSTTWQEEAVGSQDLAFQREEPCPNPTIMTDRPKVIAYADQTYPSPPSHLPPPGNMKLIFAWLRVIPLVISSTATISFSFTLQYLHLGVFCSSSKAIKLLCV